MNKRDEYNKARAAIAGVQLARMCALGFVIWYGIKGDWMGVGLMVFLIWLVGMFLPVTDKK